MYRHVYIHVPFCARRCSYCDFSIAVRKVVPVDEYLGALEAELRIRFGDSAKTAVETIYFGGGTPSRLGGEGIARAVALLRRWFPADENAEITIEANPEDVTSDTARAWREAGVNRVSLGAQTFDENALEWMHRAHGAGGTVQAVDDLRCAGITNLSLDLIFALPNSLGRNLQDDIRRLLELRPSHVSVYGLTVEPNTPLGKWVGGGTTTERPEEGYEEEYLIGDHLLTSAGLEHYEVSNYALRGSRSRHNSSYWSGASYVGLGPAAHDFDGTTRRWNARHYRDWRDLVATGVDPFEGSEILTPENRVAEEVYLGLRTDSGLPVGAADMPALRPWIDARWITVDGQGIARCTPLGWLRLDTLAATLTHHRSR